MEGAGGEDEIPSTNSFKWFTSTSSQDSPMHEVCVSSSFSHHPLHLAYVLQRNFHFYLISDEELAREGAQSDSEIEGKCETGECKRSGQKKRSEATKEV